MREHVSKETKAPRSSSSTVTGSDRNAYLRRALFPKAASAPTSPRAAPASVSHDRSYPSRASSVTSGMFQRSRSADGMPSRADL